VVFDERADLKVLTRLCALDRYERLALSRRKRAIRQFEGLDRKEVWAVRFDRTKPIYLRGAGLFGNSNLVRFLQNEPNLSGTAAQLSKVANSGPLFRYLPEPELMPA
jgi:hypothetical protein